MLEVAFDAFFVCQGQEYFWEFFLKLILRVIIEMSEEELIKNENLGESHQWQEIWLNLLMSGK